jgi:hypothetical protein
VLADPEPDVAAGRVRSGEVAAVLDVVLGGTEEVGAAGDDLGDSLGDVIEDFAAAIARGGGVGKAKGAALGSRWGLRPQTPSLFRRRRNK